MNHELWIRVTGEPIPQGSKVAAVTKDGRAFMRDAHPGLKAWRENVAQATWRFMHQTFEIDPLQGAVSCTIWTYITRPKSVTRTYPHVKPDVDKLARAILDGLTDGGAWDDDSQVVELSIRKAYATEDTRPGALIHIHLLKDTP